MKAFKIEMVITGKEDNVQRICKSMEGRFKPKKIFYSKCEWFEK